MVEPQPSPPAQHQGSSPKGVSGFGKELKLLGIGELAFGKGRDVLQTGCELPVELLDQVLGAQETHAVELGVRYPGNAPYCVGPDQMDEKLVGVLFTGLSELILQLDDVFVVIMIGVKVFPPSLYVYFGGY